MSDNPILSIKGLCKSYGSFALRQVDIELPQGAIMGFVGRNGAGKSTTIKAILNVVTRDSGIIEVDGMDNIEQEVEVKKRIGYVGENLNLYQEVTAKQFYRFFRKYYRNWDERFFALQTERFGIDLNKKIGSLSKGTAVKLSLALALSHRPKLLILDEPTTGLDPVVRHEVLELLRQMVDQADCSVFFSSHIIEDVDKIADYVTCIDAGVILFSAARDALPGPAPLSELLLSLVKEKGDCVALNR